MARRSFHQPCDMTGIVAASIGSESSEARRQEVVSDADDDREESWDDGRWKEESDVGADVDADDDEADEGGRRGRPTATRGFAAGSFLGGPGFCSTSPASRSRRRLTSLGHSVSSSVMAGVSEAAAAHRRPEEVMRMATGVPGGVEGAADGRGSGRSRPGGVGWGGEGARGRRRRWRTSQPGGGAVAAVAFWGGDGGEAVDVVAAEEEDVAGAALLVVWGALVGGDGGEVVAVVAAEEEDVAGRRSAGRRRRRRRRVQPPGDDRGIGGAVPRGDRNPGWVPMGVGMTVGEGSRSGEEESGGGEGVGGGDGERRRHRATTAATDATAAAPMATWRHDTIGKRGGRVLVSGTGAEVEGGMGGQGCKEARRPRLGDHHAGLRRGPADRKLGR